MLRCDHEGEVSVGQKTDGQMDRGIGHSPCPQNRTEPLERAWSFAPSGIRTSSGVQKRGCFSSRRVDSMTSEAGGRLKVIMSINHATSWIY